MPDAALGLCWVHIEVTIFQHPPTEEVRMRVLTLRHSGAKPLLPGTAFPSLEPPGVPLTPEHTFEHGLEPSPTLVHLRDEIERELVHQPFSVPRGVLPFRRLPRGDPRTARYSAGLRIPNFAGARGYLERKHCKPRRPPSRASANAPAALNDEEKKSLPKANLTLRPRSYVAPDVGATERSSIGCPRRAVKENGAALRQLQDEVSGMADEPPAGLEQPLLR
jgi:hypothetical protein